MVKIQPLVRIPFKDVAVKFMWNCYDTGLCTYEEVRNAMRKLSDERIQKLMDNGVPESQAIDEAIDSVYAIDHEELKAQKAQRDAMLDVLPF